VAYWSQQDLEDQLSPATVLAIFDDNNNGTVSGTGLAAVQQRSDQEVDSYLATNYPKLTFPVTPVPVQLKWASLEFGIVFARDRKSEYWAKAEDNERQARLKEARAKMDRFAQGQQYLLATNEPKPSTVGGIVVDDGRRVIADNPDGTDNAGDFG